MSESERLKLEASTGIRPRVDRRPHMDQPPPVRLGAIEDILLDASIDMQAALDDFYVTMLEFAAEHFTDQVIYQAENFNLIFRLLPQMPPREHYRFVQIEVRSLAETQRKLIEREIDYARQKGLTPGTESLALVDPAGNWIELVEGRAVM